MPREWTGSVFRSKNLDSFSAKWKEWADNAQGGRWRITKGFSRKCDAQDHLAEKRREYRDREAGRHDQFADQRKRPIAEHVTDFLEHCRSNRRRRRGRRGEKHHGLVKARLEAAIDWMKVETIGDLSLDKATRYLNHLLDDNGAAVKTRNDYSASLKQFSRWLEDDQRLLKSPLAALQKLVDPDSAEQRQALSWEQVRAVAASAIQRVLQKAPKRNRHVYLAIAEKRALTVLLAGVAGLRNGECANLRWGWLDFEASSISLPHTVTKSGREECVPLHDGLRDVLQQVRRRRGLAQGRAVADSDLVVGEMVNGEPRLPKNIAARIREDAKWGGISERDQLGRKLDLHAMRTSFANILDELGVPEGIVADLMRHKPVKVTRANYLKRRIATLLPFVNMIPAEVAHIAGLFDEPAEGPTAKGTDEHRDAPVSRRTAN